MNLKRILPIFLSLAMIFSLMPTNTAFASPIEIDDVTLYDADDDGYYEIGTADELYAFAKAVNLLGKSSINGKLTKNITVNKTVPSSYEEAVGANSEDYRSWMPIGKYDERGDGIPYIGTFDGNGKTISGLYCIDGDGSGQVGLFGSICRNEEDGKAVVGTVKNLTVKDSYFCSTAQIAYIGAVVGYNDSGTVTDCKNENSTIYYNADSDFGSGYVGGVVGYSDTFYDPVEITKCSNSGAVSVKLSSSYGSAYTGGVVGYSYTETAPVTIADCSNSGIVSAVISSSSYGSAYVGGVVGYSCTHSGSVTIAGCSNSGDVNTSCAAACAGGMLGYSDTYSGSVTVQNCYNIGAVNAASSASYGYAHAGGVIGYNYATTATVEITSCYNAGSLDATSSDSSLSCVGGVIGRNTTPYAVTITNCYYLGDGNETDDFEGTSCLEKENFQSGSVAYLLNHGTEDSDGGTDESSSETIWKQTLGVDDYPNFTGLEVLYQKDDDGKITLFYNDLSQFKIHSVGDDKKSATVVLNEAGAYTIVFADYDGDRLANVEAFEVTVDNAQAVRVVSDKEFTLGTGDKIMLWDDFEKLTPMCEAYVVK